MASRSSLRPLAVRGAPRRARIERRTSAGPSRLLLIVSRQVTACTWASPLLGPQIASAAFCTYSATWNASTSFMRFPVHSGGSRVSMPSRACHCGSAPSLAHTTFIVERSRSTLRSSASSSPTSVFLYGSGMGGGAGIAHDSVTCLVPWRLRRACLATTRARMLSILRHHHAVDSDLDGHGLLGDDVRFAHGRRDALASLLVTRGHGARQPANRRVAERRGPHLTEQVGRLLLGHARERSRR